MKTLVLILLFWATEITEMEKQKIERVKIDKISQRGVDLIKSHEKLSLKSYWDVNKWAIGYGHRQNIKENSVITRDQAELLLRTDIKRFETAVNQIIDRWLPQNQFDALVSFAFNLGEGKVRRLKEDVETLDFKKTAQRMKKYHKADGKVLRGLVKRRNEEARMYLDTIPKGKNCYFTENGEYSHPCYCFEEIFDGVRGYGFCKLLNVYNHKKLDNQEKVCGL